MASSEEEKRRAFRRSLIVDGSGIVLFVFAAVLVVWLWFGAGVSFVWGLVLASVLALGLCVCRGYLLDRYPDPRQDPAGQGCGSALAVGFWAAVVQDSRCGQSAGLSPTLSSLIGLLAWLVSSQRPSLYSHF